MESTIIQASNQRDKGVPFQKEGDNKGKSPNSFYQQALSQPTSQRRQEEQVKELEEAIFPKLQDPKNPKRCHGQCLQHGQNLDGIEGQIATKNETTLFPKKVTSYPYVWTNDSWRYKIKNSLENSFFDPDKDKSLTWFLKQVEILNELYPEISQKLFHIKILKKCGGEMESSLRRRCKEPCSTEESNNALEDIVKRTKIGRTCKKLDIKSPKKPFMKKDKPKEPFKPNTPNTNEQRKCNKCREYHNEKEDESDSEKDTEESETSESYWINTINGKINNIDLTYEVLDVNLSLPQVGTSDTSLKTYKMPNYIDPNKQKEWDI
ncbi:hypothetical protein O181_019313 [Austropuccinia psidii MF-1]|uniref:Uncharacterized protein n=1 Tax=Austropuccinia psidii MF-1 TaxID=1389203 RepID=A0A9Q3C9F3_9BASI|nr:hypothetical protein [Austropuccinia psidii MF-1]